MWNRVAIFLGRPTARIVGGCHGSQRRGVGFPTRSSIHPRRPLPRRLEPESMQSERPKVSLAKRRPIFVDEQLEQTSVAAHEPFRTLFTVAALTGARISELCALTWAEVRVADVDDAEIEFGWQVDRHGNRRPTKTDGSARTVPIPQEAIVLARHKVAAVDTNAASFVFATGTGRPLQQRGTWRELCGKLRSARSIRTVSRPTRFSTRWT
jgi:integrase